MFKDLPQGKTHYENDGCQEHTNKLLQTIKENDEGFDRNFFVKNTNWRETGLTDNWICPPQEPKPMKDFITQSRIKELEALVEMIKGMKETGGEDEHLDNTTGNMIYNQALSDIIKILQDTINQLKTN